MRQYLRTRQLWKQWAGKARNLSSAPYVVLHPEEMAYEDFERIYQRQKGIPWTILTTGRSVREFAMEDLAALEELLRLAGDHRLCKEPLEPMSRRLLIRGLYPLRLWNFRRYGFWLVLDKKTGGLIRRAGIETMRTVETGRRNWGM